MPRIRTVKPEFWQDEKLAPCSPLTRLVFLGLISMADDAGRVLDNVKVIDAFVFPETSETCRGSIDELSGNGRIQRGETASGQRIIQIVNWTTHQKIEKPNLRGALPPIKTQAVAPQDVTEHSPTRRGNVGEESGNDRRTIPTTYDLRPVPTTNDQNTSDVVGLVSTPHSPTTSSKRKRPAEHIVAAFESCRSTVCEHHYDALATLLEAVPEPMIWAGIMTGMATGLSAPNNRATPPEKLGAAVQDFVAAGKHVRANPGLFRGFVARAKAPPTAQQGYTNLATMQADDLRGLRVANRQRERLGQPLLVEPANAAALDAQFPDGRTFPPLTEAA